MNKKNELAGNTPANYLSAGILAAQPESQRVLRIRETSYKVGLSKTSVYESVKKGTFPKPLRLSERSSGWLESELNQWLEERAAAREV